MSCGSVDAKWKEVPRMLNAISGLETAAESHAAFATGAVLPSGVRIAQSPCTGAVLARPRAFWAADVFGRSRMAADLTFALAPPTSANQYPHPTPTPPLTAAT